MTWENEPKRHSLARQGIATKDIFLPKNKYTDEKLITKQEKIFYSLPKDIQDKIYADLCHLYESKRPKDDENFRGGVIVDLKEMVKSGHANIETMFYLFQPDIVEQAIDNGIVDLHDNMTPEDKSMMKDINSMISERTHYGQREESIPKSVGYWSNGSESWMFNNINKSGKVELDANEIATPYDAKSINRYKLFIEPLPLYSYSTEAKERGQTTPAEARIGWAMAQLRGTDKSDIHNKYVGFGR